MHYIEKKAPRATRPRSSESTVVIDGNALFYSIGKAAKTFKDLASNIFDMIPNIPKIHFSTDMYKEFSVKSMERSQRGDSDALIIKRGDTKVPQDFKGFLSNDENKKQLICLLLKEWINLAPQMTVDVIVMLRELETETYILFVKRSASSWKLMATM